MYTLSCFRVHKPTVHKMFDRVLDAKKYALKQAQKGDPTIKKLTWRTNGYKLTAIVSAFRTYQISATAIGA